MLDKVLVRLIEHAKVLLVRGMDNPNWDKTTQRGLASLPPTVK